MNLTKIYIIQQIAGVLRRPGFHYILFLKTVLNWKNVFSRRYETAENNL